LTPRRASETLLSRIEALPDPLHPKEERQMPIKKTARKAKSPARSAKGGRAAKGGAGKGLAQKVQPSTALADIVGSSPTPRTEVTKRVWDYIKKHGLQDKVNRRMINADDKLRAIFGGKKQVSMFEMTKLISKHLS
jgi:chromatin remodeling complex protein RSC6